MSKTCWYRNIRTLIEYKHLRLHTSTFQCLFAALSTQKCLWNHPTSIWYQHSRRWNAPLKIGPMGPLECDLSQPLQCSQAWQYPWRIHGTIVYFPTWKPTWYIYPKNIAHTIHVWYVNLHDWWIFMGNVGKYTSPMGSMGYWHHFFHTGDIFFQTPGCWRDSHAMRKTHILGKKHLDEKSRSLLVMEKGKFTKTNQTYEFLSHSPSLHDMIFWLFGWFIHFLCAKFHSEIPSLTQWQLRI